MNPELEPDIYLKNENKEKDFEKDLEVEHNLEENICQKLKEEANQEAREVLESEADKTLLEKIKKKGKMAAAVGFVGLSLIVVGCEAESPENGAPEKEQVKYEQLIETKEMDRQDIEQMYENRLKQIAEITEKTKEEVHGEMFSLIQKGYRELGEWNDKEDHSEIQVRPGYETYRIEGEDLQKLTDRIAFEVTDRVKNHLEEGSKFSIAVRLTEAHVEGHFSNFVVEDRRVAEGLFERVQEEEESEGKINEEKKEEVETQEEEKEEKNDSGDVLQPPF